MLLDADDSHLVLVDYQVRLMPAIQDHARVLACAVRLARIARLLNVPVWGTEQNPLGLGHSLPDIRSLCDKVVEKSHFSAVGDGLAELLRPTPRPPAGNARSLPRHLQKAPPQEPTALAVVLAGCEAHVCLLQTALELLELDFDVWVVTDACGSRSDRDRDAAFDRLAGAGAELVTAEMVAFEWMRDSRHPRFKEVLALIR